MTYQRHSSLPVPLRDSPHTDQWLKSWFLWKTQKNRKRMCIYSFLDYSIHVYCLVAKWCPTLFATPWIVSRQAPLSMEFPRQEYWSGLLFPPPGGLPDARIQPASPALAGRFLTAEPLLSLVNRYSNPPNQTEILSLLWIMAGFFSSLLSHMWLNYVSKTLLAIHKGFTFKLRHK